MSFRYVFSIVLLAVLFLDLIAAESKCADDEFPWVGDGCISRSSYKAIFISGIVFACLSFVLLLALLGLCIWKQVKGGSRGSDVSDTESGSSGSRSRSSSIESEPKRPVPVARQQAPPPQPVPVAAARVDPPVTRPKPKPKPKPTDDDDYSSQF